MICGPPTPTSDGFSPEPVTKEIMTPRSRPRLCGVLWGVALGAGLAGLLAAPAVAQFGQNKVQYRSFNWRILETEHFRIHYYEQERDAALEAARMAERGYEYLSDFYQHQMQDRIPLILYSNHQDFEQSNVIGGFISEGTGGVTESLKGRVTLPLTGSYAELNHVLVHELVHAFQFDMLQRNVRGLLGIGPLPLWMIEGMAEWVSNGMDPVTTMWIVDAVKRDKLPTVEKMSTVQDIRVYRMGQALYEVIGKNYGKERVRRILKRPEPKKTLRDSVLTSLEPDPPAAQVARDPFGAVTTDSLAFAPGTTATASLDKLWRAYADSLARTLGSHLVDPDSVAERLTHGKKYGGSFHLAPAIAPAGDRILYYSSSGFRNELFIAERQGEDWKHRSLVAGEETPELESLPLLSASADWSPDGRFIAFVATEEGQDALRIFDFEKRRIVRTIRTELLSISNPSYSPNGRFVVFTGLVGGHDDLFLVEVASKRLVRLTQDAHSERTPRFSPQGDAIVFATDRGTRTDLRELRFGSWNLARMSLRTEGGLPAADRIEVLLDEEANHFAPQWSPDGSQIAFVSDGDGTYQVYTLDLATGDVRRRTRFDSGVLGIVPTGPAFSWGRSGDLVFSVFRNGGWNLYRTAAFPEADSTDSSPELLRLTRSIPRDILEEADDGVVQGETPYKVRLTPEYAVLGALYVGNTGAAGSGQLLLGDMLGNHYLLIGGNLRSELDESELLVQYADLGGRWQWGLAGYQFRNDIGLFTAPDTLELRTLVRRGIAGQIVYPFSRFRRAEFGLDFQAVTDEFAVVNYVSTQVRSRSNLFSVIPQVALVQDNAAYSGFTPVAGGRWRASLEQSLGDLDYTFGVLDYRRYYNIRRRGAFAVRGVLAGSWGPEPALLRIGGPDTFRGADFGAIIGTRIGITSLELRFPVIPSTEIVRGIVFVDAATSWEDNSSLKLADSGGPLGLRLRDLRMAYGFGLRAYLGLPLRLDAGVPTDLERNGDWITTFSIGFDY